MEYFPAIRGSMGRWTYFIVKLSMRELSKMVQFATEYYDDQTLDEAVQREIGKSRVQKEIVEYLKRQDDRFFSSLVVAAVDGNPKWHPVHISDDPRFQIFADDDRLRTTFGLLAFDGKQQYYALDGQHRLSAIKQLLDKDSDHSRDAPPHFADEEVAVLVVTPDEAETKQDFLQRYRRLFGNLNRYAKKTSLFTNIVMDEDDAFAILTRRLITDHHFFKAPGRHKESVRIKMRKGKAVSAGSSVFTSLETLYMMNTTLLMSAERARSGWKAKTFTMFRRPDDELDDLYDELVEIWDALIAVLPKLERPPAEMRCHKEGTGEDSALFWPVTQELIVRIARDLLDAPSGAGSVQERLAVLGEFEASLHRPPWRHLVLVRDGKGSWRIRSEDRKKCVQVVDRIVRWQLGQVPLNREELGELRDDWHGHLLLLPDQVSHHDNWWAAIEAGRVG